MKKLSLCVSLSQKKAQRGRFSLSRYIVFLSIAIHTAIRTVMSCALTPPALLFLNTNVYPDLISKKKLLEKKLKF